MFSYLINKWKGRRVKICEGYIKGHSYWTIIYYSPSKKNITESYDSSCPKRDVKIFNISKSFLIMSRISKKRGYDNIIRHYCKKFLQEDDPHIIKI